MSRTVTLAALGAALALGLAACGSGGAATKSGSAHASSGTLVVARSRPTRMYKVALSGRAETTGGAPQGRGVAIIAFHGDALVCWRFAHLHGFVDATHAGIHAGRAGRAGSAIVGLSSGPRLHHEGCVSISPTLTRAIWGKPGDYYVSVLSAQHPQGAVRAQL
jgi:CHRD domain